MFVTISLLLYLKIYLAWLAPQNINNYNQCHNNEEQVSIPNDMASKYGNATHIHINNWIVWSKNHIYFIKLLDGTKM